MEKIVKSKFEKGDKVLRNSCGYCVLIEITDVINTDGGFYYRLDSSIYYSEELLLDKDLFLKVID